jgi:hypothetical protein
MIPWDFDYDNPYIFPDYQDEMRYDPSLQPEIKTEAVTVYCCSCNEQIDTFEMHILKTLHFGWHLNDKCMEDMVEWAISEFQRRESKVWIENK